MMILQGNRERGERLVAPGDVNGDEKRVRMLREATRRNSEPRVVDGDKPFGHRPSARRNMAKEELRQTRPHGRGEFGAAHPFGERIGRILAGQARCQRVKVKDRRKVLARKAVVLRLEVAVNRDEGASPIRPRQLGNRQERTDQARGKRKISTRLNLNLPAKKRGPFPFSSAYG